VTTHGSTCLMALRGMMRKWSGRPWEREHRARRGWCSISRNRYPDSDLWFWTRRKVLISPNWTLDRAWSYPSLLSIVAPTNNMSSSHSLKHNRIAIAANTSKTPITPTAAKANLVHKPPQPQHQPTTPPYHPSIPQIHSQRSSRHPPHQG
jgi:hypothetical protein